MLKPQSIFPIALAAAALLCPVAAQAEIPDPVRALINAAIDSGDPEAVATVIDLARQTNPDDVVELDAILAAYDSEQLALAEAEAETEAAAEQDAIRRAGIFQNWGGKGELGAFRSTGNSSNTGVTAGIELTRQEIGWQQSFKFLADFQRNNGVTTREQFLAAYQADVDITDRLFAFGLGQWERDRFQGFSGRVSASAGLGYRVLTANPSLTVQAGPAYRVTRSTAGDVSRSVSALAALDFDWEIAEGLKLTQDASAFVESDNSTFVSSTGLQAALSDNLSARVSYTVEHDTDPPIGAVQTDTLSRITLIYDF
ncbi:MAG: DUF481 domain-containing protein [Erythrobacter sp.]